MKLLVVAVLVAACGGGGKARSTSKVQPALPIAERAADWLVPLLPDGAQVVVEVDLARLRANPVVGALATQLLGEMSADTQLPGLPMNVAGSPLAAADALVFGAYGVGTAQAATIIVLATTGDVPNATRVATDIVALGPSEWVGQLAARAAIAQLMPDAPAPKGAMTVAAAPWLVELRDHAMPAKAPGAILRVAARLSFDARVALARTTEIEMAPARLSVWADVVDDAALIIDADAADPGDKNPKGARKRMVEALRGLLASVAAEPGVRALGFAGALNNARFVEQGTWVRAIVAVGPRLLSRAVERARAMLPPAP